MRPEVRFKVRWAGQEWDMLKKGKLLAAAGLVLSAGLCACAHDSPQAQGPGAASLKDAGPVRLGLGVTYKTDGRVWPAASDSLYQSLSGSLGSRDGWNVRRVGGSGDDFAPVIAAIAASTGAARVPSQHLLVLVENRTEHPATGRVANFLSGMPFGAYWADHASRRYDITIAYRDAAGPDRIRRVHQDLLFVSRSGLFGERDGSSLQTFDRIVSSAIDDGRPGGVALARPQLQMAQRTP
jgi:hypothetical protein